MLTDLLLALLIPIFSYADSTFLDKTNNIECHLYLAESLIPGAGRAILTGRNFEIGEDISDLQTLAVKKVNNRRWQLDNYVFSAQEREYSMIIFGREDSTLGDLRVIPDCSCDNGSVNLTKDVANLPYSNYHAVKFEFKRITGPGEEVFISYGEKSWFDLRMIPMKDFITPIPYDMRVLETSGVCLTFIESQASTLPLAGKGVFARKTFKKGDILSVSPVLLLSLDDVLSSADSSLLLNYVISRSASKLALLPIEITALINHQIGEFSNVQIDWYEWKGRSLVNILNNSPDVLRSAPFAQLDLKYVATRDIAVGEELFMNYGNRWMSAWTQYLARLLLWQREQQRSKSNGLHFDQPMPVFRSFIEAPDFLLPDHWFNLGSEDD